MRFKKIFFASLTILAGGILGWFLNFSYWEINFSLMSNSFVSVLTSPVGVSLLENLSHQTTIFLIVALRAFPWSVAIGLVAGIVFLKIKYQRLFCYSTLLFPIINFLIGYYALSSASNAVSFSTFLWARFGEYQQVNFAIYTWYFITLYTSSFFIQWTVRNKLPSSSEISE